MTSATQKALPVAAGVSTPPPARKRLEFAYDYRNRRIAKRVFEQRTENSELIWKLVKDLRFVHDGYQMIAELDHTFATGTGLEGSRVNRTFLWGQDVSGTMTGAGGVGGLLSTTYQGVSYQVCSDANGNVTGLVPTSGPGAGTLMARFDYDPFGKRITNTGPDVELCPFGFSSKYTDSETGIVNYELRPYQAATGRFMCPDPIEEDGGANLYGFVWNDAVNRWDYLGMFPDLGGHGDSTSPENAIAEVWNVQRHTDRFQRWRLGLDRNLVRLNKIIGHFDQDAGNSFVFTCKHGWVDMFHFWNAAGFAYISRSVFLTVEGGGAIEVLQTVAEPVYNNVYAPIMGKDKLEPSAWSPEDLSSNLLGALFGRAAIDHDAPVVLRSYLSNRRSRGALFGGPTKLPLSADRFYNLAGGWQRFLREAGAPSWRRYWGAFHNALLEDLQEYKRTRPKVFTISGGDAYKKKSKVYKCVCDGDHPKPPYRMSGYFLPK